MGGGVECVSEEPGVLGCPWVTWGGGCCRQEIPCSSWVAFLVKSFMQLVGLVLLWCSLSVWSTLPLGVPCPYPHPKLLKHIWVFLNSVRKKKWVFLAVSHTAGEAKQSLTASYLPLRVKPQAKGVSLVTKLCFYVWGVTWVKWIVPLTPIN